MVLAVLFGKASGKKVLESIASFVNIFCLVSVTFFSSLTHVYLFSFNQGPLFFSHMNGWHLHTDGVEWRIQNLAPGDAVGVLGRGPLF